jgi:hypothetical protein
VDRDQRDELRRWAGRLAGSGTAPETKAAGRAIALLLDEVERLEREMVRSRAELDALAETERERERAEAERAAHREKRRPRRPPPQPESRLVALPVGAAEQSARLHELASAPAAGNGHAEQLVHALPRVVRGSVWGRVARPRRRPRPRRRRIRLHRPALPRPGRRSLVVAGAAAVAAGAAGAATWITAPDLAQAGPPSGALLGEAAAEQLVFAIAAAPETLSKLTWTIDGEDMSARASLAAGRSLLRGSELPEGKHEIVAVARGWLPGTTRRRSWLVSIDRTPPEVAVDPATARGSPLRPLTLKGRVEAGSTLTANGADVPVEEGRFALKLPQPPNEPVAFVATDRHGNTATAQVPVALVPRRPRAPLRAVHVTFHAWADDDLREGILRLIDEGRINSVELDLKDESGIVGFDAAIPFAKQIGSVQEIYDLDEAVTLLHRKGVHVIGRIVAFRDPVHARAAWERGWRNQVVQTPSGTPYAGYGGFTNFASPVVRRYNVDVAKRAAEAGVDDILYDYVRRPDGPRARMVFPRLRGTPEASIVSFLAKARRELRTYEVFLGASVFGVAATRPKEVAQPIRAMARHADYIAPMLYPSHWARGEYDVAHPNAQPYDIVRASLTDFQKQTKGTGARVVPWLQDFTLGVTYGPGEVRAQIAAAADAGIREWLLWDPLVTYTAEALDRRPLLPPIAR